MSELTHHTTPRHNDRYIRQMSLPGFGPSGQEALERSHVVVIGAGGLGSPALMYLAAAGVGHITIIDDDVVDRSNLHRQIIHSTPDIGVPKVDSARETLLALNPRIEVDIIRGRLEWPEATEVLQGADVVLDGSDNFPTRHCVSAACAHHGIPHIWAAILGWEAQLSVFWAGHGPIYEDLFSSPPAPGTVPNCAQAGVVGPLVGIMGSAMAMEAIKFLCGIGECLIGKVAYFDSLNHRWDYLPLQANPQVTEDILQYGPPLEGVIPAVSEPPAQALLVDVREPHEFAEHHIPGAWNMPLSRIKQDGAGVGVELKKVAQGGTCVVYCQAGVRSEEAISVLAAEEGHPPLMNLRGGLDRWQAHHP